MLSPETTMGTDEKFDSSLVRISIDSMKNLYWSSLPKKTSDMPGT
jgi:hypothetical protein